MEKQEIEQLDLKDWVFVFATPNMGWLGKVQGVARDDGSGAPVFSIADELKLSEAYTFTVMEFPVPQGPQIGFLRNAGINNIAECLGATPITVARAVALVRCSHLESGDQAQVVRWVEARRADNVSRRAKRSGLVLK